MSAESPRHVRSGGPLTVPSQPPSDRSIIDAVSGFINDVTLSSSSAQDPKDVIQWARFETADINEPTPEDASENDISPLLLILGYGAGVQVWLIPPTGEAQEVLSWRQGSVRVLRILPTPQRGDCFASKRPLIALCDSVSPGPAFCSLSFISIKGGEQVKSIKFKNPILDVLANKRSVVVSFSERFAVFDASTLEDRMAITTCYPCPCPLGGSQPINPLALGDRWLAYADKKLNQSKRSSGGFEGEGVTSYTATVLHAAKSLSKGLRGLGESVAQSLGGRSASQSPSPPNADLQQPGVITIIDIEGLDEDDQETEEQYDPIVAHFVAHSEAIIAVALDASGMVVVTADRRGHDFHVFRINPHPLGPAMASVHHLYVLHRGDTTAKVQDIAISPDTRWAAISTLRGTTHMFAISPYGGSCGVRTHASPRVVNRLSRFHRSAGLPIHAGQLSNSPVSEPGGLGAWCPPPRAGPPPAPAPGAPLAQLRPTASLPTHTITRTSSGRQRLSSLSEDTSPPLLARARFGPACSSTGRSSPAPTTALYLMAATGCLSHIALHVRPARNVPKEKICDETPIELEVEPIAQWPLQRPAAAADLLAPLPSSNPLLQPLSCRRCADMCMSEEDRWLSQVEIVTHAGPHRRLWMGPQFVFKTYNCGSNSSLSEAETVEVDTSASRGVARSNPVNMPGVRPIVPVLIDSGSASECSLEHSPSDSFRRKSLMAETGRAASVCDVQLKEDLAEAMKEDQGWWEPDPDRHTRCNADEARFRPVVRAPAALPPAPLARPLPRTTTIPAVPQPLPGTDTHTSQPLSADVVIPAALTHLNQLTARSDAIDRALADDEDVYRLPKIDPEVGTIRPIERHVALETVEPKVELARAKDVAIAPVPVKEAAENPKRVTPPDVPVRKSVAKSKAKTEVKEESVKVDDNVSEKVTRKSESKVEKSSKPEKKLEEPITRRVEEEAPVTVSRKRESKVEKSPPKDKAADKKDVASRIDKSFKQKDVAKNVERVKTSETRELTEENVPSPKKTEDEPENITIVPSKRSVIDVSNVDSVNVDFKVPDVNKDLKGQEIDERKSDRAHERGSAAERECEDIRSLPKSNRASDDIQPTARTRIKKSPTPKSVSDRDSEVSVKDKQSKKIEESIEVIEPKDIKAKEIKKQKDREIQDVTEVRAKVDVLRDDQDFVEIVKDDEQPFKGKESKNIKDVKQAAVALKVPIKKSTLEVKSKSRDDDIKTEEQAWDMLLSEPQKPPVFEASPPALSDKTEDKPKSKRNRKAKKSIDDLLTKTDEDSFVEIHAIEEKQSCSGDLVSISSPFEDADPTGTFMAKSLKTRAIKSPEKTEEFVIKPFETVQLPAPISYSNKLKGCKKTEDICFMPELRPVEMFPQIDTDLLKTKKHFDGTASESTSFVVKDPPKTYKSKSLSPYPADKDVYVINTTGNDFPEIQITRGNKQRKRSPQPVDRPLEEKEVVQDKPVAKSWSSIAASKNTKKVESTELKTEVIDKKPTKFKNDYEDIACALNDYSVSSTKVSLQEKLYELCKRTDIMVAECDAPSELNFVEEHHVLHDLPPLEPLDFALDDFKLEVMRDSLMDIRDPKITSPICKINIDDILSNIKETTSKAIESSAFNLIDLEKLPSKREKGFSVIEGHKITSQEVKLDEERNEESEVMEKSSDEDPSPVASTDSDKEDKKSAGASNLVLPSSKQSAKSKKSRRKKK